MISHPYRLINAIFAGIIFCVFLYSGVFHPDRGRHPIPSSYKLITGEDASSAGLSRGFSAIVRLQLEKARNYNPYSLRIFGFFFFQFLLRLFFLFNQRLVEQVGTNRVVIIDATVSFVLFIVAFDPFIREFIDFR